MPNAALTRILVGWALAILAAFAGAGLLSMATAALRDFYHWSGWILLLLTVALSLYGLRQRLGVLSAQNFLLLHLHLGWISALLFAFHARGLPQFGFGMLLWIFYALALATGLVGYLLCFLAPKRQWDWDAIPFAGISQARNQVAREAIAAMEEIMQKTMDPKLAAFCDTHLLAYFSGPTPMWGHWMGSKRARNELLQLFEDASYFVADRHEISLIEEAIRKKDDLDARRAQFWLLRGWLFSHILFVCLALVFVLVHIILIHSLGG